MAGELEVTFAIDGKIVKKASLWYKGSQSVVQVLELRENARGTDGWYPVVFHIHEQYHPARLQFIGVLAEIAYENANNSADTSRENIFVRGSLPSSLSRKNGAIK